VRRAGPSIVNPGGPDHLGRRCTGCFGPLDSGPCRSRGCSEAAVPHPLPRGARIATSYLIGRVLGRGGFGITYLAWDQARGTRIAIKEYFPLDIAARIGPEEVKSASAKQRGHFDYGKTLFLEEGNTLRALSNVLGVVPTRGVLEQNGTAYLLMDYIEGETLHAYTNRQGRRLHTDEALQIGRAVLRTLAGVHARDWLHRDIAPDNIYLVSDSDVTTGRGQTSLRLRDGTSVQVLVLDFGAARQALGGRTQRLDVILKPGYAPFEQYQERVKLGPPTDIYALSATLFELLTGQSPPPAVDRIHSPEHATLTWPPDIRRTVSPHVRLAIEHGLQVMAKNRPQTAEAFERELFQVAVARTDPPAVRTNPGDYAVGRSNDCQIVIPDDTVSGQHAILTVMRSGVIRLCDQNSTNGTFVLRSGAPEKVGRLGVPVGVDDIVRFGDVDVLVEDLIATLPKTPEPGGQSRHETTETDPRRRDNHGFQGASDVSSQPLADRLLRVGATLIDALLVAVVLVAGYVAGTIAEVVFGLGMLALATMQLVMLTQSGQTIGKRLVGIRIVDATSGDHAGFFRVVVLRTLLNGALCGVPYAGQAYALVDYCFVFREDRRCLHDHIAGTKVIKA